MPRYEFGCNRCDAIRDVLADHETAQSLELVCVECGGVMTQRPVLAVNILLSRASRGGPPSSSTEGRGEAQRQAKSCGHGRHCRCAINLKKPNPFRKKIREAAGVVDEQ